jgi:hypothetical protein
MRRFLGFALLAGVGAAAWQIGGTLSSDALSMAMGIFFGVVAGIPTALLLMGSGRRRNESSSRMAQGASGRNRMPVMPPMMAHPQPPVIVITGNAQPPPPPSYVAPSDQQPRRDRRFKVVGEKEEWLEEW